MADITIDAVVELNTTRGMRSMVFTTSLIGYFFFIDADFDFKYVKTTDGGATWGGLTTIFTGSVQAHDVWFDQWTSGDAGTIIHCWYVENGGDDVRYRQLDTATDTLGTERIVFNGASAAFGFGVFVSGAKARGGNLLCAFDIDAGAETGTYRSTDGGVTWGVRTNLVEATLDRLLMFPGNAADSQDMWALYLDASADSITLKVHDDSADTNSESAEIAPCIDNTTIGTGQNPFSGAIRHSDGHLITAIWTELDSATGDFRVFDINGAASITEKTAIATDIDDCYYPSVLVNNVNDDIYVAYVGKRDGSETLGTTTGVYYVKSTDGGANWSAGDTAYSAGADDWFQTWAPLNGPRFAVAWRDTVSQALLSNFDNSISLAAGTPVSRAAPVSLEALTGQASSRSPSIEALISVAQGRAALLESLLSVSQPRVESLEALTGVAQTATAPLEALAQAVAARGISLEALTALAQARVLLLESLESIAQASTENIEALQGIAAGRTINLEALGQILVSMTAVIPLEALSDSRAARVIALESLAPAAREITLTLESLIGVMRAASGSIEVLVGVRVERSANIEGLAALAGTATLPLEALQAVAALAGIPFEALLGAGAVTVVNVVDGVAYFQIALNAEARFTRARDVDADFTRDHHTDVNF